LGKSSPRAYTAASYDRGVRKTLPHYDLFHEETLSLVRAIHPRPHLWVDTGCGTGTLVRLASREFGSTRFVLADPDEGMLRCAAASFPQAVRPRVRVLPSTDSAGLSAYRGRLRAEVVTAIQCHHYLDRRGRLAAVQACRQLLVPHGLLVVFENIKPETKEGVRIGLERWASFQVRQGKTKEAVRKHMRRFGRDFFPITPSEHLALFRRAGFRKAGMFWLSYLQAGFYAIR